VLPQSLTLQSEGANVDNGGFIGHWHSEDETCVRLGEKLLTLLLGLPETKQLLRPAGFRLAGGY
jgi:hypothetical protein